RFFRETRLHDARDSRPPFAAALRLLAGEVIAAAAGMAVDDAKGGRLLLQIKQDAHEHDVLDDVGEIAGVEGVAVVHGGGVTISREESNPQSFRDGAQHQTRNLEIPGSMLRIAPE